MKKILTLAGLTIIMLILDNSVVPFFSIKGFSPSLLFTFIISYSIVNGYSEGLWLGVFAGLFQDIYFANILGVNALTNMICAVISGFIGVSIFKEKTLIPVLSNFVISIFKGILVFVILYVVGVGMSFRFVFFNSLYNLFLSIPVYRLTYKLCSIDYMRRNWKF
ncbi:MULTISPECIES: rod shape-determining protein MreD [unclassified Clostridium]|nr:MULTISPECIES: rod shape-determining protein MreD [unclassified Clostridium]KGK87933.1 rod shape-determining protein MreD [Clostridium sp. HMP27]